MPLTHPADLLNPLDTFARRHLGPSPFDLERMVEVLGVESLEALIDETVPAQIRLRQPLRLEPPRSESAVLAELRELACRNRLFRSWIGMGYYGTLTPGVIQGGTPNTPPIRPRSPRGGWRRCSTFSRWSST